LRVSGPIGILKNVSVVFLACAGLLTAGCGLFSEKSPYDLAVAGDIGNLKRLLDEGLDVNQSYGYGEQSLLFGAVEREDPATAKFLIERGADINFKNSRGDTPLIHSVNHGREKNLQLLLDHGAHVKAKNKNSVSAFSRAVSKSEFRLAELLLLHGADVDFRDEEKNSALHVAARNGDTRMVQLLLKYKARVNVKNEKGFTPLYYPEELSYRDISTLLKKHGARLAHPAPTVAHYQKTYQKLLGQGPLRIHRVIKQAGKGNQVIYSPKGDRVAQVLLVNRRYEYPEFPGSLDEDEPEHPSYTLQITNVNGAEEKFPPIKLNHDPYGVRFAPDGNLLVSRDREPGLDVWDPVKGQIVRKLGQGEGTVLDSGMFASGNYLLVGERKYNFSDPHITILDTFYLAFKEITGGLEHSLWIYDYETGELVREFIGHRGKVRDATFSFDGQYAASIGSGAFNENRSLQVWETTSGRPIRVQRNLGWSNRLVPFPKDRRLALANWNRILILDMENGQVIKQIREGGHHLGLLREGRYMALLKNDELKLVDVHTGRVVQKASFTEEFNKLGTDYNDRENFASLKASPSGDSFVATTNHGKMIFFGLKKS